MQEVDSFVNVTEAGRRLGVSISTVWRMIRRGDLPSIRKRGRRLVPKEALTSVVRARQKAQVPPFGPDHPIFRLAGAGKSGGKLPGSRDKHAILNS